MIVTIQGHVLFLPCKVTITFSGDSSGESPLNPGQASRSRVRCWDRLSPSPKMCGCPGRPLMEGISQGTGSEEIALSQEAPGLTLTRGVGREGG